MDFFIYSGPAKKILDIRKQGGFFRGFPVKPEAEFFGAFDNQSFTAKAVLMVWGSAP